MRVADLLEVALADARIPDVVGLDGDRDSAAAVLQAVRAVDDDAALEPTFRDRLLEVLEETLRALGAARALRVVGRTHVEADEHVVCGSWHVRLHRPVSRDAPRGRKAM